MTENTVSASHFRVHFKDIANAVTQGQEACTVERHGLPMVVVVSLEDAEFLRQHRWGAAAASPAKPLQEKAQADTITLIHPDSMPLELVKEAYGLTEGTTDLEIENWRYKAFYSIKGRLGKAPAPWAGPSG